MRYKVLGSTGYAVNCPKIISLDTEYSERNVRKADLLSISIGVSSELTYILDDFSQVQRFIDEADIIFTWNGVVDQFILSKNNYNFPKHKIIDAMLLEHLIDERLNHGLGDFALREFNDNYKDTFWSKYKTYQEAPKEEAYEYEMRDGCYTFAAGTKYLEASSRKLDLVRHVHKLQWALFDTEIKGIKVDLNLMIKTKQEMGSRIQSYLPQLRNEFDEYCKIWELKKWQEEISKRSSPKGKLGVARPIFKFSSDTQIRSLLYDESLLGLQTESKTKKGNASTSYDTLKELGEKHPEISTLVKYKEEKAVYATFVEGMLERVEDGRIYPGFFINGTATGRISHNNPNVGNLPTEGVIRNFFISDHGNSIVGADYSQLEVVVEANLTEDPQLLKIINEGASKHDITAEGLGIDRNSAKTLNFALQYGAGIHKISKILKISHTDAEDIFKRYWELYSGVRSLKERVCKNLNETSEVTNIFGRTRHFDKPKNEFEKAKQERQAYNHLIQGVGADITNMATYLISDKFKDLSLGRLWFSVHDEIVTEVRNDLIDQAKDVIVKCMEVPSAYLNLKYPIKCVTYGPMSCWSKG